MSIAPTRVVVECPRGLAAWRRGVPRAARHGRSARLRQLVCPHDRAVRDCPELRLARPRGGETAQPLIWRALRRLPTANQDDHPAPFLNPVRVYVPLLE